MKPIVQKCTKAGASVLLSLSLIPAFSMQALAAPDYNSQVDNGYGAAKVSRNFEALPPAKFKDAQKINFEYIDTNGTANIPGTCYFTDQYFKYSSFHNNNSLRTMSLALAMSAFNSYRASDDYTNRCENFYKLMDKLGFSNMHHNKAYDIKPTVDTIGVAIASKKVQYEEGDYTLLAVGVRGAGYEAEWGSNVLLGPSGQAEGFSKAKDQVIKEIKDYIKKHNITKNVKVWIAGFSRAGAVSNLTGEEITKNPSAFNTVPEDVYCYTFEAPQGAELGKQLKTKNIHNTLIPYDLVPFVAPTQFGFTRAGVDDFILPDTTSPDFKSMRPTIELNLMDVNPELSMNILDEFSAYNYDSNWDWNKISQRRYIERFMEWMTKSIDPKKICLNAQDGARKIYDGYDNGISDLMILLLGKGNSNTIKFSNAAKEMLTDKQFLKCCAAYVGNSIVDKIKRQSEAQINQRKREAVKEMIKILRDKLYTVDFCGCRSNQDNSALDDLERAILEIGPMAKDLFWADYDNWFRNFRYLFSNTESILFAHSPEYLYAWLMAYDENFTK